jgi:hypothetical protein
MPRVKPKPKFKDDQFVLCWMDFAADDVPPPGVMKRGMRLRGDNPVVRAHPNYFVDANTPDDEIPNIHAFRPEPPPHEYELGVRVLEQLPDEELMECTASFTPGLGSEIVRKVTRFPQDDWRVLRAPQWFRPVVPVKE